MPDALTFEAFEAALFQYRLQRMGYRIQLRNPRTICQRLTWWAN